MCPAARTNVLRDWRTQALKGLPPVFERQNDVAELKATHAQQLEDLYVQVGRLTTQINWLKVKLPPSLIQPDKR